MSARLFITLYMKIDWNNKLKRLTIRQGYYDSSNETHGQRNTYLEFQLRFLSSSSAHKARGRLSDTFWSRGEIISLQFPAHTFHTYFGIFPYNLFFIWMPIFISLENSMAVIACADARLICIWMYVFYVAHDSVRARQSQS